MYRLSPAELIEVKRQVTELLQKQLIEPSTSEYGSPILFVQKKDGTLRMVIDYRALNITNRYPPLPRIDDLYDKLQGSQYFTSLDAASGFHQILLKESDRPKTAFRTPFGHYQFRVLPFGLINAPATFRTVMNKVFSPPTFNADGSLNNEADLADFVLVFIDDILIFSKTAADHIRHIRAVLSVLRREQLLIKMSKCVWGQTELPYLGHIVSKDGIKTDPKKVQSVVDWPQPNNVTEIQQFLGMTNYFNKYLQGYANQSVPLTDLLHKDTAFNWSAACAEAFAGLKQALTTAPCLALPETGINAPMFNLVCDASGYGLGAVLMQTGRPVAFWSRKMTPAEQNYHITEQELLAVMEALKVFRCYLDGIEFNIVTDHKPNTFLDSQPTLYRRQARWIEELQRYNFNWVYEPGRTNVADPLSRNPAFKRCSVIAVLAGMTTRARSAAKQPVYKDSIETPVDQAQQTADEFTSNPNPSPSHKPGPPNSEQSAQADTACCTC